MARGPDFFKQMTSEQIAALEEYARHPGKTIDDVAGYLQDQGVPASRSAVGRWRQDFLLWDRQQRASMVAKTYLQAAASDDATAVTEASLRKFNELVFEALASGDDLDTGDLMKISIALKTALGAQSLVDQLKAKGREQMAQMKALLKQGSLTEERIDQATQRVFG